MNGATATLKGKSMFGVQELSRRRTAPAHGFGSSTRNHASKVFMGPEHAKTSSLSCTPGPCYEVAGACGSQHDSGKAARDLKVVGLPATLLIGRDGRELGRLVGPAEWDTPEMIAFIETVIANQQERN